MKKYMILPSNSDLNRGDQALVWNTKEAAEKAGYKGEFYMLAEDESLTYQSQKEGIKVSEPILKHPGRKFTSVENTKYDMRLILKWGSVAVVDFIKSRLFLNKFTRSLFFNVLSQGEKETLNLMKECDAFFVKGGGFIHSAGRITDTYTVYYSLYHIALAHALKKPVYVMPNSFGPFKGFGIEKMVKKVLSKCKVVYVRESYSKAMLDEIKVESKMYPDVGFFVTKNNNTNKDINTLKLNYPEYKLVGITARPYRFPSSDNPVEKYNTYISSMIEFSEWLYENKFLPVFVDHTLSNNTHESDRSCIDLIIKGLDCEKYAIISDVSYTCRDLKSIYSEFDFVIGTRFHSVIFSLSEGIPSLAITYGGNKGQGIMNDLNMSEYAIPMSEFEVDRVKHSFIKLNEKSGLIRENLVKINANLRQEYLKLVNEIGKDNTK